MTNGICIIIRCGRRWWHCCHHFGWCWQFCGILCSQRSSHTSALFALRRQVGLIKESCKQNKITKVHGNGQINIRLWYITRLRSMGLEETIGPHINGTANDHLCQLQWCYNHCYKTWWIKTCRFKGIVRIHYRMHTVIHDNEPTCRWGIFCVWEPWIDEYSNVMVPVQED